MPTKCTADAGGRRHHTAAAAGHRRSEQDGQARRISATSRGCADGRTTPPNPTGKRDPVALVKWRDTRRISPTSVLRAVMLNATIRRLGRCRQGRRQACVLRTSAFPFGHTTGTHVLVREDCAQRPCRRSHISRDRPPRRSSAVDQLQAQRARTPPPMKSPPSPAPRQNVSQRAHRGRSKVYTVVMVGCASVPRSYEATCTHAFRRRSP